jgi:hypothetical protein
MEVEISNGNWQPLGQVMIINEAGIEQRSMTYLTGYIAPLGYIKFNSVAHIPSRQLKIFDSTIATYNSTVVPDSAREKVRRLAGTDTNYADTNDWVLRNRGVLLIAGAARPLYPYYDPFNQLQVGVCDNWQAAFFTVDVESLDLLSNASFPCNQGLDAENAPFDYSQYFSHRFVYQEYLDKTDTLELQDTMKQRAAFVGTARVKDHTNLDILASRSDLYFIATGQNYNWNVPPHFATRTFSGPQSPPADTAHDYDEEGLDIDVRYYNYDFPIPEHADWQYVVCGYTKSFAGTDTTTERIFSMPFNDSLYLDAHDKCPYGFVFNDTSHHRPSRATAVTWAAPQNDPDPDLRFFAGRENGYIIAGSRDEDGVLQTKERTFIKRYPNPLSPGGPITYAEYGRTLSSYDTIASHPGFSIIARPADVDEYDIYVSGWWEHEYGFDNKTTRWFHVDNNLDPVAGYEYVVVDTTENYGVRMCNDNNIDGFVIVGDKKLATILCDTNYYSGGGLPYIVKITGGGMIYPESKLCDAEALPLRYTCEGDVLYDPKEPNVECDRQVNFSCELHSLPLPRKIDTLSVEICPTTYCQGVEEPFNKSANISPQLQALPGKVSTESNNALLSGLTVIPNPASDGFTVKYKQPATLTVRDLLGQIVFTTTLNGEANVPTIGLVSGVYYIEAVTPDGNRTSTHIIIHR